jgi:chromosome segregation ATPase
MRLENKSCIALESAALAEKLLNDLLKTTEGFQKLKKINESLQSQVSNDNLYYEPLKKENERVVKENNELHLKVIQLQEELEARDTTFKSKLKQAQNERTDLHFVCEKKDHRIKELDRLVADMQARLEKVMQKVYNPQAQDIVKGLRKDAGMSENVIAKR